MSIFITLLILGVVLYIFFKGRSAKSASSIPHSIQNTGKPDQSQSIKTSPSITTSSSGTMYSPPSVSVSKASAAKEAWVSSGKDIPFKGYTISGGMIYFGEYLTSVSGWGSDPALINPKLDVNRESPDRDGRFMSYWPSYSDINPSSRAAYLEWLSTGKNDPKVNIGYVFLYFYGLERRILHDAKASTSARAEIQLLLAEIKRLLSIYGNNNSFRNYADNLIGTAQILYQDKKLYNEPVPVFTKSYEYPLALKFALGQIAVDTIPLPAEWALTWVECDPSYYPRTPAHRCSEEFEKLFCHKYQERFGNGYIFKPNKTTIKGTYTPASRTFNGTYELRYENLPDVTVVKRPIDQLKEIAEQCIDELDAYSRYRGRNPGDINSPAALALLPKVCLEGHKNEKINDIAEWLRTSILSDCTQIDISALIEFFPSLKIEAINKKDSLSIAQFLAKLGAGIEPDVRFGGPPYKPGPAILFRLSSGSFNSPTPDYATATTILHLATMVASASNGISPEEEIHLERHLETWLNLKEDERLRLRAHMRWLLAYQPSFSGIKKKIEQMSTSNRSIIGKFMVSLAQSDGFIDADEMRILSKIYSLLGLEVNELYSHAHNAAVEPVAIKLEDKTRTFTIPSGPSEKKSDGFDLDMASIEAKMIASTGILVDTYSASHRKTRSQS
jgi:uncharacterized tellurite resistance protein B-like protein